MTVFEKSRTDPVHGDPSTSSEEPTYGGTKIFGDDEHTTVFVETCREDYDFELRSLPQMQDPNTEKNLRTKMKNYMTAITSHEMGHQPGSDEMGDADHAEGGLMRGGELSAVSSEYPDKEEFRPKTILRFRKTSNWSKK
ncbi:MAG: hypothetical protein ABI162_11865 [Luteolibacter sp.]